MSRKVMKTMYTTLTLFSIAFHCHILYSPYLDVFFTDINIFYRLDEFDKYKNCPGTSLSVIIITMAINVTLRLLKFFALSKFVFAQDNFCSVEDYRADVGTYPRSPPPMASPIWPFAWKLAIIGASRWPKLLEGQVFSMDSAQTLATPPVGGPCSVLCFTWISLIIFYRFHHSPSEGSFRKCVPGLICAHVHSSKINLIPLFDRTNCKGASHSLHKDFYEGNRQQGRLPPLPITFVCNICIRPPLWVNGHKFRLFEVLE